MVYEALLAADRMSASDEESRSLGLRSMLLISARIAIRD